MKKIGLTCILVSGLSASCARQNQDGSKVLKIDSGAEFAYTVTDAQRREWEALGTGVSAILGEQDDVIDYGVGSKYTDVILKLNDAILSVTTVKDNNVTPMVELDCKNGACFITPLENGIAGMEPVLLQDTDSFKVADLIVALKNSGLESSLPLKSLYCQTSGHVLRTSGNVCKYRSFNEVYYSKRLDSDGTYDQKEYLVSCTNNNATAALLGRFKVTFQQNRPVYSGQFNIRIGAERMFISAEGAEAMNTGKNVWPEHSHGKYAKFNQFGRMEHPDNTSDVNISSVLPYGSNLLTFDFIKGNHQITYAGQEIKLQCKELTPYSAK